MGITDRIKHAWNAFSTSDAAQPMWASAASYGNSSPTRIRISSASDRTIITSIYTRLAIDFAATTIRHVRMDENGRFAEEIDSGLNSCLMLEANIDQAATALKQDLAMTMFDQGVIAVVPTDTSLNPNVTGSYDILTMRVGTITQWYPRHVRVSLYNEAKGRREEITVEKRLVAIIENPFYSVMNEPSSTLQRLVRKLNLLDAIDEASGSGKLDLIIQLPYVIKSDARRAQAEKRREDIEIQLKGSKYGIAYTDGTEKVTQLNRPAENNLMGQIEYLIGMLYGQLGLTPEIMNGTADEKTMTNYMNRTIAPLLDAVVEEFSRKFLTKTARSQRQSIIYFQDMFKFIPISSMADLVDKLARNEVLSSNEIRGVMGFKPSSDPKADKLQNSNMPVPSEPAPSPQALQIQEGDSQNGS